MNYEVTPRGRGARGEARVVGLRELGEGQYEITLDGRTAHVDVAKSGRTIYSIIEDGRQYEGMVDEQGEHGFDVLVGGRLFHLEAVDERSKLLAAGAQPLAGGRQSVAAEMPGKVVKLNVAVGDAVTAGQGVAVVEAMKMENEIPSPIDGVVVEIGVSEGATVEAGAVLFVVDSGSE